MKFSTIFERAETIPAPTGTAFDNVYTMKVDKEGRKFLEKTGETNRYELIQAQAEETDIANILAKAVYDPTVLEQRAAQYFDATDMPKTLAEAQTKILEVQQEFYKLPVEQRNKFNNSIEKYVAAYGTKEWAEAMDLVPKEETKEQVVEEKATKEVKTDESK